MTVAQWAERQARSRAKFVATLPRRAVAAVASAVDDAVSSVPNAIFAAQKARKFIEHRIEDVKVNINHISLLASSMLPEDFHDPWDWEPEEFEEWS